MAVVLCAVGLIHSAYAGQDGRPDAETSVQVAQGYEIPGVSFHVFLDQGTEQGGGGRPDDAEAAVQTVIRAFDVLVNHRMDYPRFDEAVKTIGGTGV